jgi:hypothetical protein
MVTIMIIGGILMLLLFSNSSRYGSRYDNYEHPYPPHNPYYPPMPHQYEASSYFRYRDEKRRESMTYTAIFVALVVLAMFLFGSTSSPDNNNTTTQETYSKSPPRYR